MIFQIKKSINLGLIIDRVAALYTGETLMRDNTNEGDQRIGIFRLEE